MTEFRQVRPIGWKSTLLVLAVSVIRGGNQVALKIALRALAPFWTAFGRMFMGTVAVGLWAGFRGIEIALNKQERRWILNLGLLFTAQLGLMHYGADFTSPAYATVLMNSNPVFTNLIAHFVLPEDRLSLRRVAGLIIAFSGICVVFLGRPDERLAAAPIFGNLMLLLSAAMVGVRTIYTQRVVRRIQPERAAFWQMLFSLPFYAGLALIAPSGPREPLSWLPLSALFYQGVIVGGAAWTAWAYLLRHHSAGALTFFNFTVPLFGVLLSAWLLAEDLTARLIVGAVAVVGGIALATRRQPSAPVSEALDRSETTQERDLPLRE